jgi:hypothetical protein
MLKNRTRDFRISAAKISAYSRVAGAGAEAGIASKSEISAKHSAEIPQVSAVVPA